MDKIKILLCGLSHQEGGGIETYAINQFRTFDKSKFHIDFIYSHKNKNIAFYDEIISASSVVYRLTNSKEWKDFFKDNKNKYDFIVFNTPNPIFLPLYKAVKIGGFKKVIVHSHNSANDLPWYLKMFTPFTGLYLKLKIEKLNIEKWACSDLAGKFMFGRNSDFTIIKNAINIEKFKFNPKCRINKRNELSINDKTTVIGIIGRYEKQKNIPFAIKVFDEYQKINPDSVLLIIGPKTRKDIDNSITKQIDKLNLSSKIKQLGMRKDINELYNALDILIMPSLYEGLPVVGVEAQISGLPCIFSNNITQMVKINDTTKFLPIDNEGVWAKAISKITNDTNNRAFCCINEISSSFDISNETKRIESIYEGWETN